MVKKNPLIKAIKEHDTGTLEHLLAKPKTDINVCDAEGNPAIHVASMTNNIALLMMILKSTDLKITARDTHGNTPLHIFAQKCLVMHSDEPVLKLIEKGCSVNTENNIGEIALHKACLSTIPKTIMLEVLLNKGSSINHITKNGETPLHYAIKMGRNEFVRLLLQRGADFRVEGGKPAKSPLGLAKELSHTTIVNRIQQTIEISDWLTNMQLDSLVPIFIQNDMFLDVLPDVDESTLDSLKITVSGQRTKLLRAVQKLKAGTLSASSGSSFSVSTLNFSTSLNLADSINVSSGSVNNSSTSSSITTSSGSVQNNINNNNINNINGSSDALQVGTTNKRTSVGSSTYNSHGSNTEPSQPPASPITTSNGPPAEEVIELDIPESKDKPNLSYSDLQLLKHTHLDDSSWVIDESHLKLLQLLGVGASGKVYKGVYKGAEVAVKVLKSFTDAKDIQEFKKEFQIVSALKAPGVVYFFGAGIKDKLCIVMEYCSRGSLCHILKDETVQFTWSNLFHLALQAISSLNSLHTWSPQILHRDLKSLNLLVTENWTVKICDFGLSRFDTGSNLETLGKLRGTYAYVAPEVYFGNKYTTKSDVYSMGMIIWEMISRCINGVHSFPFAEYPQLKFDYQILIASAKRDLRPTFPASTPQSLIDLISKALLKDATLRPTTQELYDGLEVCRNEYLENKEEWDTKRIIPEQQMNPKPPQAAGEASPVGEKRPPTAVPEHLNINTTYNTRSRSSSSPVEPVLLKKSSKGSILNYNNQT
eukprot:gene8423-9909_t